jgi:hypothetical protein
MILLLSLNSFQEHVKLKSNQQYFFIIHAKFMNDLNDTRKLRSIYLILFDFLIQYLHIICKQLIKRSHFSYNMTHCLVFVEDGIHYCLLRNKKMHAEIYLAVFYISA